MLVEIKSENEICAPLLVINQHIRINDVKKVEWCVCMCQKRRLKIVKTSILRRSF